MLSASLPLIPVDSHYSSSIMYVAVSVSKGSAISSKFRATLVEGRDMGLRHAWDEGMKAIQETGGN